MDGVLAKYQHGTPAPKVCKKTVNFIVFYPDDGSSGPHCLSLHSYNVYTDDDSPNHTWLLFEPCNLSQLVADNF